MAKSSNPLGQSVYIQERTVLPSSYEGELVNVSGVVYFWDDVLGLYKEVGSGGGGGDGFNYVENSTPEFNTDGWVAYATSSPNVAPVNFGGTPNGDFTLARNTTTPLTDTADFLLTKTANNRQGHGYHYEADLQSADLASILRTAMNYKTSANYLDGFMRVYLVFSSDNFSTQETVELTQRDVDATSLSKLYLSEGQSPSAATKVRLCLHVATSTTTAWTMNFARVKLSQREIARGPIAQYLGPVNIAASWTNTDVTATAWRTSEGWAHFEVAVDMTGTPAGTVFDLTLPYSIDTDRLGTSQERQLGRGSALDSGTASYDVAVRYRTPTTVRVSNLARDGADKVQLQALSPTSPHTFAVNDAVVVSFSVPIAGWNASQTLSSDFGGRAITFRARKANQTGLTAGAFNTVSFAAGDLSLDRVAGWSTNTYTVQETGDYVISVTAQGNSSSAGDYIAVGYRIDSGSDITVDTGTPESGASLARGSGMDLVPLTKGQAVQMRVAPGSSTQINAPTFSIHKIQTPQSLAGGEVVVLQANKTSGSHPDGGGVIASWDTPVVIDSHGSFNATTGVYTVNKSGFYFVSSIVSFAINATGSRGAVIQKNSSSIAITRLLPVSGIGTRLPVSVGTLYNKGDTINILSEQDSGGALNHNSTGGGTVLSIMKVN